MTDRVVSLLLWDGLFGMRGGVGAWDGDMSVRRASDVAAKNTSDLRRWFEEGSARLGIVLCAYCVNSKRD